MISRFKICIFGLLGVLLLAGSSFAEYRVWKDKAGNSIEAEYLKVMGDKVAIRGRNGKVYKFNPASLSEPDQSYVELQNPPRLVIEGSRVKVSRNESKSPQKKRGAHYSVSTGTQVGYRYEGTVEKLDKRPYSQELQVYTYFVVRKTLSITERKELGKTYAVVLKGHSSTSFQFEKDGEPEEVNWASEPFSIQFRSSENMVRCDDGSYQRSGGGLIAGDTYFGFLAVLMDARGEILAMTSDKSRLEKIHRQVMDATAGDYLENIDWKN